jgi:hypothetical protein
MAKPSTAAARKLNTPAVAAELPDVCAGTVVVGMEVVGTGAGVGAPGVVVSVYAPAVGPSPRASASSLQQHCVC